MAEICIVFCRCSAGIVPETKLQGISDLLNKTEADVFELNDLCAHSVDGSSILTQIESRYDKKIVIACYPRAVEKMLEQAGASFLGMQMLNIRELSAINMADFLDGEGFKSGVPHFERHVSTLDVPGWFPVIDRSRCTACGQCVRFCLFGVYKRGENEPRVIHPLNCKNLCPACGRTCPSSAIIFPRLKENTVLAGADPGTMTFDLAGRAEGTLLSALQQRSKTRQSVLKSGVMQLAEEERRKALEQLKKEFIQQNNSGREE